MTDLGLTPHQLHYATVIVAAVKSTGLPERAAHIALETALAESGLKMYANGNQPSSLKLPHDAVGWDHGSVGLFQQQVGGAPHSTANWGTVTQLMDAGISTGKFLAALGKLAWQGPGMTNWKICQLVQGSAFSDGSNYKRHDTRAIAIGTALWTAKPAGATTPAKPAVSGAKLYDVLPGDNLTTIAAKFKTTAARLVEWNRLKYPTLAGNPDHISADWYLIVAAPKAARTS
jgi:hypothetical protein